MTSRQHSLRLMLVAKTSHVPIIGFLCLGILYGGAVSLDLQGCKSNPVEPPPKNPREFVWTIDTIASSDPGSVQTLLKRIWGSSDQDVYVAGHSDIGVNMYHFDGRKWSAVRLLQSQGGPFRGVGDFEGLIGFSTTDLYAVGKKYDTYGNSAAFVIRFDGALWTDISVDDSALVTSCWGFAANDLWLGSLYGSVYRYDGHVYTREGLGALAEGLAGRICGIIAATGASETSMHLLISAPRGYESRYFIVRRTPGSWSIVDSPSQYTSSIWLSPSGKLYRGGSGVFVADGGDWRILPAKTSGECVRGTSDENIIAVGSVSSNLRRGAVYHFDGVDWRELQNLALENVLYTDVWMTEHTVFVVGYLYGASQMTIVARGR